ncbi:MAG: methylmalonyl-CoA epimerase [Deferribacteres bacterium]|nr:methylmalonyl-CoA epimerase [candidate division KSB1 bacterium]MCB9503151.1 methylmalonyl-CoA epimerase [Deferribacteres bacterium]
MIKQIDHIGIAVNSLEEQLPFYRDVLQLKFLGFEEVEEQKVKVAMLQVGEVKIELLQPSSEDSPIAKFIAKKGEGMHHIAYRTEDIDVQLSDLQEKEIALIDTEARNGAHGMRIAFIHPKSSGRVLSELCQVNGGGHE